MTTGLTVSRRSFAKSALALLGAIAVSGSTMFMVACGSVVNDLVTAFQSILNILISAGIVPGGLATIVVTALNDVIDAVQAYESAPAADKQSLGEKLAVLVTIAQADLQSWFSGLNLTGTLAAIVESLVAVILSELAALLPTLPQPVTIPDTVRAARALSHQITYRPVGTIEITKRGLKRASERFRVRFNNLLTADGYPKAFKD
jgi:hypothetical protein